MIIICDHKIESICFKNKDSGHFSEAPHTGGLDTFLQIFGKAKNTLAYRLGATMREKDVMQQ
jgi:hypothetical protein